MLLKGAGKSANDIVGGAEWSTLSHDAFPAQEFDFMLSNPPYGKSWKKDLEAMGGKDGMRRCCAGRAQRSLGRKRKTPETPKHNSGTPTRQSRCGAIRNQFQRASELLR
jgi:hypothetical protein